MKGEENAFPSRETFSTTEGAELSNLMKRALGSAKRSPTTFALPLIGTENPLLFDLIKTRPVNSPIGAVFESDASNVPEIPASDFEGIYLTWI